MSSNNTPFYYEIVTFSFIDIAPVMHEDGTVTGARSARFNGKTIQVEGVQGREQAVFGVFATGTNRLLFLNRRRPFDDVADFFAVHQRSSRG